MPHPDFAPRKSKSPLVVHRRCGAWRSEMVPSGRVRDTVQERERCARENAIRKKKVVAWFPVPCRARQLWDTNFSVSTNRDYETLDRLDRLRDLTSLRALVDLDRLDPLVPHAPHSPKVTPSAGRRGCDNR